MYFVGGTVWLEIGHYLGIAFWLGSIAMLDFRLLGLSKKVPVEAFHLSSAAYAGFGLTLITGVLMYLPNAAGYNTNPIFLLKLLLLALAFAGGFLFQNKFVAQADQWQGGSPPLSARLAGAASLLLWFGILWAGRQITYFGFTQG